MKPRLIFPSAPDEPTEFEIPGPNDPSRTWAFTDHVCRVCFSRIMASKNADGTSMFRCTGCAISGISRSAAVICSCGMKLPRTTRDAGIRCVRNDAVTPETPFEIVARQVVT